MHKTGCAVRAIYASCAGTATHRHNNRIMYDLKILICDPSEYVIDHQNFIVPKWMDGLVSFGQEMVIG